MEPESFLEQRFPVGGISLIYGFDNQKPVQLPNGVWGRTCVAGVNVLGHEVSQDRRRGGTRAGLSKYLPQAAANWILQELNQLVSTGMSLQSSQSGRVVTLLAVCQGQVFTVPAGGTAWTMATNTTGLTPPLNYTGLVYSTTLNQRMWFADGINWCYYNPSDNTINLWAPTAGQLPVDRFNNTPRLICTWRGRIVVSGLLYDPQDWFMSAVGDPTNWNYFPNEVTPTQAIAGQNAPQGIVGDSITSLCPYSDDVMIFFGDHSVYLMKGDPLAGGQIDLVTDAIGGTWGICWCRDPYGTIYFMSNKCGMYTIVPGQQPQRISQQIEQLLATLNTGLYGVRLIWDDRYQGVHVFITLLAAPAPATHFFYEARTGAWWNDTFANNNHNPLCCCVFDGNLPGDRSALIGSWDGYVRYYNPLATDDDGSPIASSVVLGPLLTPDLDTILIKDLQAIMGGVSGPVNFAVYAGASAEVALANPPVASGTWSASRNFLSMVRRADHAFYIKITSTNQWAMEQIRCRVATEGKVRRRGGR